MAIFCVHDGTQLPDDATFCYKCGKPITASALSKAEEEKLLKEKRDALFLAIMHNDVDALKDLLERTAKFANAIVSGSSPALMLALDHNHIEAARLLLQYGADPECANTGNPRPLMKAVKQDNKNFVKLLLQYKADPNEKVEYGGSYLDIAKSEEVAALLLAHGANVNATSNPLDKAIRENRYNIVKLLLDKGADVKRGTPIISAVGALGTNLIISIDILQLLIERGANVNVRDKNGYSALFLTYLHGDVQKMELLLQNKADATIPDDRGNTIASSLDFRLGTEKYNKTLQVMSQLLTRYGRYKK